MTTTTNLIPLAISYTASVGSGVEMLPVAAIAAIIVRVPRVT